MSLEVNELLPDDTENDSLEVLDEEPVEIAEETVQESQEAKEVKPASTSKVVSHAQSEAPSKSEAKAVTGTYNFGYAMYTGQLKNGKPNGRGKLVFSTAHTDNVRNYTAETGDYIEGNFTNGSLDNGSLYKKDGSKVKTIY